MKKFLFLITCTLMITFFFSCKEEALTTPVESAKVEMEETVENEEVLQAKPPWWKRIKVELGHHGVYNPNDPDACGNQGGCACPLGICIYVTPAVMPNNYWPSQAEINQNVGIFDFYPTNSGQAKFEFHQHTALTNGTVPLEEGLAITFENDPIYGNQTFNVVPDIYVVDFSQSNFGSITVNLE